MNKRYITEKIKNKAEEGSILLSVLVVFVVLLTLVMSASSIALSNTKKANFDSDNHSSFYVAESGINEFTDKMIIHLTNLSKAQKKTYSKMTSQVLSETLTQEINKEMRQNIDFDKADVKREVKMIFNEGELDSYRIVSTADVDGQSRTLQLDIEDILLSLKPSEKPASEFLSKYGLVIKNKAHLGFLETQGSIFLMAEDINKDLIKFNGASKLIDYSDKTSYLYYRENLSFDQFAQKLGRYEWDGIPKESFGTKMKPSEPRITQPKFEMPKAPNTSPDLTLKESQIKANTGANYRYQNGSLEWISGHGTLKLNSKTTYIPKLNVKSKDDNAEKSILYVDVGDEIRNLVVDDFNITGGLIVEGKGSLNIFTRKDNEFSFSPLIFSGGHELETNGQNSLALVVDGDEPIIIKALSRTNAFIGASFIANNIQFLPAEGTNVSVNLIALGENVGSVNFRHNSIAHGKLEDDNRRVFIFYPNGEVRLEGIKMNGFLYANDLIIGQSHTTFRHDPDLINHLPPLIQDILDGLKVVDQPGQEDDDDVVDKAKIKFGKIREVN